MDRQVKKGKYLSDGVCQVRLSACAAMSGSEGHGNFDRAPGGGGVYKRRLRRWAGELHAAIKAAGGAGGRREVYLHLDAFI